MIPSFVGVYDAALTASTIHGLLEMMDAQRLGPGETATGFAPQHKTSCDIRLPPASRLFEEVTSAAYRALTSYVRAYPSLLSGGITLAVQDPGSARIVELSPEKVGMLSNTAVERSLRQLYLIEEIRGQRYPRVTGHYRKWHHEQHPTPGEEPGGLRRVLFFLVYLNTIEDGGETEFLHYPIRVRPVAGRMVIAPGGFTHTHRGNPSASSAKNILASWFLYQRPRCLFGGHPEG